MMTKDHKALVGIFKELLNLTEKLNNYLKEKDALAAKRGANKK